MSVRRGDRLLLVWAGLVVLTLVSAVLAPSDTPGSGTRGAAAVALALGFVKARFVALDFMELRDAPRALRGFAEAWLAVVGSVLVVLLLRAG